MSRYIGRHRKDSLPPPDTGPVELPPGETLTLVPVETLTLPRTGNVTEILPANTWADPPGEAGVIPARLPGKPRGPKGQFIRAGKDPDEQDDTDDQDPEPGDPVRQVPGEKDPDPRV